MPQTKLVLDQALFEPSAGSFVSDEELVSASGILNNKINDINNQYRYLSMIRSDDSGYSDIKINNIRVLTLPTSNGSDYVAWNMQSPNASTVKSIKLKWFWISNNSESNIYIRWAVEVINLNAGQNINNYITTSVTMDQSMPSVVDGQIYTAQITISSLSVNNFQLRLRRYGNQDTAHILRLHSAAYVLTT